MGLTEFCVRLRVLVGATVLKATVQGLSRQAAAASPRACRNDTSKERPAKRSLVKEEVASPAVAMGNGSTTSPRKRRASCSGNYSVGDYAGGGGPSSGAPWIPANSSGRELVMRQQ